jgi:hypothetical protein
MSKCTGCCCGKGTGLNCVCRVITWNIVLMLYLFGWLVYMHQGFFTSWTDGLIKIAEIIGLTIVYTGVVWAMGFLLARLIKRFGVMIANKNMWYATIMSSMSFWSLIQVKMMLLSFWCCLPSCMVMVVAEVIGWGAWVAVTYWILKKYCALSVRGALLATVSLGLGLIGIKLLLMILMSVVHCPAVATCTSCCGAV